MLTNRLYGIRNVTVLGSDADANVTRALIPVVGISHEGRDDLVRAAVEPGLAVFLYREPDNPVDRNAVQVRLGSGEVIGYIPAPVAAQMSNDLFRNRRMYTAHVHELNKERDYALPTVELLIERTI